MALMSRLDLEALFKNGKRPSEKDFANLIESVLNKRDDQFMGRWKTGQTYRTGDVVIFSHELWEVAEGFEDGLCSTEPPSKPKWQELIILESDGDWKVFRDKDLKTGIMWAQVYDLIGIGKEFDPEKNDLPNAKLDIINNNKSQYLIFPKSVESPTISLFQLEGGDESPERDKTYFITGLENDKVNFLSDTSAFVFRKGEYCEDGEEAALQAKDGVVLMTIRSGNSGLAQIGISTPDPSAMLDITDGHKGQFLFSPEDKKDPAFSIINLDPGNAKNYMTTGVGKTNSVFISDAPRGFIFKHGAEYNEYFAQADINQAGKGLMIVFLDDKKRTRLGIGTDNPKALIEATDDTLSQFELNPEHKEEPAINLTDIEKGKTRDYIAYGLGKEHQGKDPNTRLPGNNEKTAIFVTNANGGYRFNQGPKQNKFVEDPQLDQGETNVVILANGKVGIGAKFPATRLEITDHEISGKFLFNLNDKAPNPAMAIINTRPNTGKTNYLTLGAGNRSSIFITNSEFGYSFRMGGDVDGNNNDVEIEQKSETLFSFRTEYVDGRKNARPREMRIFPENTGTSPAEVHISGIVGIEKAPVEYELDIEGKSCTLTAYQVADRQKMRYAKKLEGALEKLVNANVNPIVFEWDPKQVKNAPEGKQFGFEGQSLAEVFPEVVRQTRQEEKEMDTMAIAYQNLVPVLVKAIKELSEKVDSLKEEINALKGK
jgi:hypothetical protein